MRKFVTLPKVYTQSGFIDPDTNVNSTSFFNIGVTAVMIDGSMPLIALQAGQTPAGVVVAGNEGEIDYTRHKIEMVGNTGLVLVVIKKYID